ncbi:MAG TPA: hypothetical protein VL654_00275 [Casimicrobiaceae bacterium]|nr:hypothetical protein [Casimicrobiaceae bacterium]
MHDDADEERVEGEGPQLDLAPALRILSGEMMDDVRIDDGDGYDRAVEHVESAQMRCVEGDDDDHEGRPDEAHRVEEREAIEQEIHRDR